MNIFNTKILAVASPGGLHTALLVLLILCCNSCAENEFMSGETFEYVASAEMSNSYGQAKTLVDVDKFHKKLMDEFGLERGKLSNNGARLILAEIGQDYIPPIWDTVFVTQNRMFVQQDRHLSDMEAFMNSSREHLAEMFAHPAQDQRSNLYRGIMYILRTMEHKARYRKAIFFTDMLETEVIPMNDYMQEPSRMLGDYEKLRDLLIAEERPSERYAGLEIVFVVPGDSKAVYYATSFWTRYFEEFGISVNVKASY